MNQKRIVIDGKMYNSIDEMPEDVRKQYEQAMSSLKDQSGTDIADMLADKNKNSIPDIIENTTGGAPIVKSTIKVVVNGKEYNSLEDLPPDVRAKYAKAMGALDANHNGIPDFVESIMGGSTPQTNQTATPVSTSANFGIETSQPIASTPISSSPAITPDTSNGWMLALLGIVLLFVCAAGAAGIWYFFLR
jgi:hypothetical protein